MNNTKQYIAVLTQAGPNPPQEVCAKTDFIKPFVWTRPSDSVYVGTCGDNFFPNTTHVLVTGTTEGEILPIAAFVSGECEITLKFSNEDAVNKINLVVTSFL